MGKKGSNVFLKVGMSTCHVYLIRKHRKSSNTFDIYYFMYFYRKVFLASGGSRSSIDGLNTMTYKVHGYQEFPLFTNIQIGFNEKQTIGEFILRAWRQKLDIDWLEPVARSYNIKLEPRHRNTSSS